MIPDGIKPVMRSGSVRSGEGRALAQSRWDHRFCVQVFHDEPVYRLSIIGFIHDIDIGVPMTSCLTKHRWRMDTLMGRSPAHRETKDDESFSVHRDGEYHDGLPGSARPLTIPVTGIVLGKPGGIDSSHGAMGRRWQSCLGTAVDQLRKKAGRHPCQILLKGREMRNSM